MEQIYERLQSASGMRRIIQSCDISDDDIQIFSSELYRAQPPSIDTFLEHRPEFMQIGKLIIAATITECEQEEQMFGFEARRQGFYHYLLQCMNSSFDQFSKNRMSFVTFNYDRSLEHCLFTSLKHLHNKSEDECAGQISTIPIIHVHGSLGPLPWQSRNGGRPYRFSDDPEVLLQASQGIKIVAEGATSSDEFEQAISQMRDAERIYFLGCGYHAANLDRLRLDAVRSALRNRQYGLEVNAMMGSGYGLGRAEAFAITEKYRINIPDQMKTCHDFLKEYAPLD